LVKVLFLNRLLLIVAFLIPVFGQEVTFEKSLYPVMEKAACRSCHNVDGIASATGLHVPDLGAPAARVEAFGKSLVFWIDSASPDDSLLFVKPTGRDAHGGGERIKPGSADEVALKAWIKRLSKLTPAEIAQAKKYSQEENAGIGYTRPRVELRRLTHAQYNNTVRDLLGDQTAPANQFPPEDFVNGYRNQIRAQSVSPLLLEAYSIAAEKLARNAFRGGDSRGLIPCKASAACGARFVREFGLKAFRRPLDLPEQKRYEMLLAGQKDFLKGAQIVVEAMLQSPHFLFRMEDTSALRWKPYAAASKLSYSLWDTMPDASLLASAARGELATRMGVDRMARRMLAAPQAREALNEFTSQWLRFDRVLSASKDRRRFSQFTREAALAMAEEARLLVGDAVWNDRNFMEVFTAGHGFVNTDLANIYGVPVPLKPFDRVAFPAGSERAGLLGSALFLTLTAKPDDSSPTARGLFVREQFLCQHVPDPPADVNTTLPPVTEAKPQTNRERMAEHASNPMCVTCHTLIDPIGLGLEKFDAIGARREKYPLVFTTPAPAGGGGGGGRGRGATKTVNLDMDTRGEVVGVANSKFSSPLELGAVLAKSSQCQECIVKQYFRYTSGRMETPADRPLIRKITEDFRNSNYRFKELIISLMVAREFPSGGITRVASNHKTQ
jgi:hypothetical protein